MKKSLILIFMFCAAAFAQKNFDIKTASKNFDVRLSVEKCDADFCKGAATFSIYRKGDTKPFQVIKVPATEFMPDEAEKMNTKQMYDSQSVVFFEDYNFDGREDLAVRDGNNGGYGAPSYQVYLYAPQTKKFVRNAALTNLAQGAYLGMFEVDKRKKVLRNFQKSGCCWHETEEFTVAGNRPKKVLEIVEDATKGDGKKVKVTTRKLVAGRWRASVKYEPLKE